MKILQIASDYYCNDLYHWLFDSISAQGPESFTAVPYNEGLEFTCGTEKSLPLPCTSRLKRALFYPKQRDSLRDIEKNLDVKSFDIIHAHTVFSCGYTAWRLSRKYNKPYIVALRNVDFNVFFKYMPHLRGTGVKILRDAFRVVFLSPAYRDAVLDKYVPEKYREEIRKKSLIIPNGIDKLFIENSCTGKKPGDILHLCYVGEINSNKNIETTIKAAELLNASGVKCDIRAVGEILEDKYKAILDNPLVSYYPRCPRDKVMEHMRASDIFVMPSHTETFGQVYAEAMSQGLPLIYTEGQGFDGQFEEGCVGYHVKAASAEEIADRIEDILSDYEAMSRRAAEKSLGFDWDKIGLRYKEIYEEALK